MKEILKIAEFKKQILENLKNMSCLMIFFSVKILKWGFMKILKIFDVIGSEGKKLAIDDIISVTIFNINEILYIGATLWMLNH